MAKLPKKKKATSSKPRRNAFVSPIYLDLPSSCLPEVEHIDVGSRFALEPLTDLASSVITRIERYTFARFGFGETWVLAIRVLLADLAEIEVRKQETKDVPLPTGEALDEVVAQAKAWRRDAMTVVAITPELRGRVKRFATGTSIEKLTLAIRALLPLVGHPLASRSGGGKVMRGRGMTLLAVIDEANVAHQKALAKTTLEMRDLYAKKGLLYEELRRLAKTAQLVAPSDAHLFSVGSHMRAHHRLTGAARALQPSGPNGTSQLS